MLAAVLQFHVVLITLETVLFMFCKLNEKDKHLFIEEHQLHILVFAKDFT